MTIDSNKPVQLTEKALQSNPGFRGLIGNVVVGARPDALGVAVYFADRGATTVWFKDEVENIPEPTQNRRISIGDYVRSLDFPGPIARREDCYVEGYVEAIQEMEGCPRYVIRVARRFFNSKRVTALGAAYVYPPVNGTPHSMGGVCDGVSEVIDFPGSKADDNRTFRNPDGVDS